MQARGPLMIEHRLIERMLTAAERQAQRIRETGLADPEAIDLILDFVHTYADRTHHGKEEDILFRDLARKPLTPDDQRVMAELRQEHLDGRQIVRALDGTRERHRRGEAEAAPELATELQALTGFYRKHIAKEDQVFFPAAMAYLSDEEQQAMLAEFWEFDRKMIHAKYKAVIEALQG